MASRRKAFSMMSSKDLKMQRELERCRLVVDRRLAEFFTQRENYDVLLEAMRYSLTAGGKRIRAAICMKFCEASGGEIELALDAACAIEMLHTYSLIHDDLPCMDDDDMRRGKPSNHIKFGEFTATLAGDALQAAAFETLLSSGLPSSTLVEMGRVLAAAAGPHGICAGQYLDMRDKPLGMSELMDIHNRKTAALISAAAKIGVLAAQGNEEQVIAAGCYANAVGLVFQARDDVLDATATADELGKPIGSDRKNDKTTFATIMGLRECNEFIRVKTENAVAALGGKFDDAGFLTWLAWMLAERKY